MNQNDTATAITCLHPHDLIAGPVMQGMDFLNNIANLYPNAISLAAGRPPNEFIPSRQIDVFLRRYLAYRGGDNSIAGSYAWTAIGQYAATDGVIGDLVSRFFERVEGLTVEPSGIMVTNGFQEALLVELVALARRGGALISFDPTYVGLTGAAMVAGLPLFAVAADTDTIDALAQAVEEARARGYNDLAIYLIPDFSNPTGVSLSLDERKNLLQLAHEKGLMIFEDTAYRLFNYDSARLPSLLHLDENDCVVQLGSFSKSFMPGTRIGYSARRKKAADAAQLTAIKSFVSVTTSPITQAILGGFLLGVLDEGDAFNRERLGFCRDNRDALLQSLAEELGDVPGIRWSKPAGGFFLVVDLPFGFGQAETRHLAEAHGVLVTPMSLFSPTGRCGRQVRLSFSAVSQENIREGVRRLATYIRQRIGDV